MRVLRLLLSVASVAAGSLVPALLTAAPAVSVPQVNAVSTAPLPQLPPPVYIAPNGINLRAVLPAFPRSGSLAERADLETMLALQTRRTPAEAADAQADSTTIMRDWTAKLFGPKVTVATNPKLYALMGNLHNDMRGMNRAANAARGFRQRPRVYDPRISSSLDMVGHGDASYPSARTSSAYVWAFAINEIEPGRTEAARTEAERIAWRRVVGGVHYPSDLAGSRLVAAAVADYLGTNQRWRSDIADVRAELALKN